MQNTELQNPVSDITLSDSHVPTVKGYPHMQEHTRRRAQACCHPPTHTHTHTVSRTFLSLHSWITVLTMPVIKGGEKSFAG